MTFERAAQVLEERQETRILLGLGRIRRHLKSLGDPQESFVSIHVAGTNGKGSVCAMLASILHAAGFKTGLYISPHLLDVCERISIDGRAIAREDFARLMQKALRHEQGRPLTYFELVTSIAFQHFRDSGVKIAVLETGLGGRFDATNVIARPAASVITSIDLDHMKFLGNTIAKIAREKAGIIKPGCPVICGESKPEALHVIRTAAARAHAPLNVIRRGVYRSAGADWRRGIQRIKGPDGSFDVRLIGSAQPHNAAVAIETVKAIRSRGLRISSTALRRGFAKVRWPGRFQVIGRGSRTLVLDGAHNPAAMRNFVSTLRSSPWAKARKTFILGILADKDHREMIRLLGPHLNGPVIATEPASPRALNAGRLAEEINQFTRRARVMVVPDALEAIRIWERGANQPHCAFVCGSFYLVGAVLEKLVKRINHGQKPCRTGHRRRRHPH